MKAFEAAAAGGGARARVVGRRSGGSSGEGSSGGSGKSIAIRPARAKIAAQRTSPVSQWQQERAEIGAAPQQQHQQLLQRLAGAAAAGVLALGVVASPLGGLSVFTPPPALAADTVKVGGCLLRKCQLQLAQCLGDPACLQNIVCLNQCNSAPDEAACQIRCGDLYGDKAVDTFNACAVSEQKCVPQRVDEGLYPAPPDCALDTNFDLSKFTGRWYITAGLNPLFDTFDCQEHYFAVPEPQKLAGKINWRINKPDGDFIERSTIQTFVQDKENPALLLNHDNEYLHYQDDWYILASKPDSYVVIYYRGRNDAWDGYGGATVYTKARSLPQELVPELSAAVESAGLKWGDFIITDNSCPPHPPRKSLVDEIEQEAQVIERAAEREAGVVEKQLEGGLRSFGKGFTVLESKLEQLEGKLGRELTADEKAFQAELARDAARAEKLLEKVEKQVREEERAVESSVGGAFKRLFGGLGGGGNGGGK